MFLLLLLLLSRRDDGDETDEELEMASVRDSLDTFQNNCFVSVLSISGKQLPNKPTVNDLRSNLFLSCESGPGAWVRATLSFQLANVYRQSTPFRSM